jgi:hypothetical protein
MTYRPSYASKIIKSLLVGLFTRCTQREFAARRCQPDWHVVK